MYTLHSWIIIVKGKCSKFKGLKYPEVSSEKHDNTIRYYTWHVKYRLMSCYTRVSILKDTHQKHIKSIRRGTIIKVFWEL